MKNKKAQIFELYLVVLTVVMCALVIWLYLIQQETASNSLVSPRTVFEIRDEYELFERAEKQLIFESLEELSEESFLQNKDFAGNFLESFLDSLQKNHKMQEFLFRGLVRETEARENSRVFFNSIYSVNLDSQEEKIIINRANIEKRYYLTGEQKNKINFPIELSFIKGKEYSIRIKQGKFYLEE